MTVQGTNEMQWSNVRLARLETHKHSHRSSPSPDPRCAAPRPDLPTYLCCERRRYTDRLVERGITDFLYMEAVAKTPDRVGATPRPRYQHPINTASLEVLYRKFSPIFVPGYGVAAQRLQLLHIQLPRYVRLDLTGRRLPLV